MLIVRSYKPADAAAFRDLNLAWIEEHFPVEASDRSQLEDPDSNILATGGRILIADIDGEPVGTVALIPGHGDETVELAKMSVDPGQQGKGIGQALMAGAIDAARDMGAGRIWLETNTVLKAALMLYRKSGFRELSAKEMSATSYSRCNCQMILEL